MDSVGVPILIGVVSVLVSGVASLMAYLSFKYSKSRDSSADAEKRIRDVVALMTSDIEVKVSNVSRDINEINNRVSPSLLASNDRLNGLSDRISVLETKIEVFWRNVGVDAARILHSPHPERAELDRMLEAFTESRLDDSDLDRFKVALKSVRDDHSSPNGDKIAAAILLRVIEQQELSMMLHLRCRRRESMSRWFDQEELDDLLEKFEEDLISQGETERLEVMLRQIMSGLVDGFLAGDKVAAAIMLRVIEQRRSGGWPG